MAIWVGSNQEQIAAGFGGPWSTAGDGHIDKAGSWV
jgi:hypothetical protein